MRSVYALKSMNERYCESHSKFYSGFAMAVKVRQRLSCEADGKWWKKGANKRKSYGGQGLNRESAFVPLRHKQTNDILHSLFGEHVDGFSGKSYSKVVNHQRSKSMLWRILQKRKGDVLLGRAPPCTLDKVDVDRRVEAMLQFL